MRPKTQAMRPATVGTTATAPQGACHRALAAGSRARLDAGRGAWSGRSCSRSRPPRSSTASTAHRRPAARTSSARSRRRSPSRTSSDCARCRSPRSPTSSQTRNVDVNGVSYTVDSRHRPGCATDTRRAQLHRRHRARPSTSRSARPSRAPASGDHPVTESTLLTPRPAPSARPPAPPRSGPPTGSASRWPGSRSSSAGTSSLTGHDQRPRLRDLQLHPAGRLHGAGPRQPRLLEQREAGQRAGDGQLRQDEPVQMELEQPASHADQRSRRPAAPRSHWQRGQRAAREPARRLQGLHAREQPGLARSTRRTCSPSSAATASTPAPAWRTTPSATGARTTSTSSSRGHANSDPGDSLMPVDAIMPTLTRERHAPAAAGRPGCASTRATSTPRTRPSAATTCGTMRREHVASPRPAARRSRPRPSAFSVCRSAHYRVCVERPSAAARPQRHEQRPTASSTRAVTAAADLTYGPIDVSAGVDRTATAAATPSRSRDERSAATAPRRPVGLHPARADRRDGRRPDRADGARSCCSTTPARSPAQIADRQDAVQRGRFAMETITRTLRSQVCLGETTEPITAGNDNGVTFYAEPERQPRHRAAAHAALRPDDQDDHRERLRPASAPTPTSPSRPRRRDARAARERRPDDRGRRHPADLPLLHLQGGRRTGRAGAAAGAARRRRRLARR